MNEQLNYLLFRFQIIPVGVKLIALVVICIVIVAYFIFSPLADARKKLSMIHNQRTTKENELNSLKKIKAMFPTFQQDIDNLTIELQQKLRKLPNNAEMSSLLKTVSQEATKSGLKILSFVPAKEEAEGYFFKMKIKVEVEGSYHQFASFCDKVAKLPRIVNVLDSNMKIDKIQNNRTMLKTEFDIVTYRFKEKIPEIASKGIIQEGDKKQ